MIPFLFNLERRAEQGRKVVFVVTDSCLRTESQLSPGTVHVSGIPLVVMGGAGSPCSQGPCSLSSSPAFIKGQLK